VKLALARQDEKELGFVPWERPTGLFGSSLVEETGIGHNDSCILIDAAFGK
jgi:hypothetical protein